MAGNGKTYSFWWESNKELEQLEDVDVGGKIILDWISEKYNWILCAGVIWIRAGTSVGLGVIWLRTGPVSGFCKHSIRTFGLHRIVGDFLITERLLASREELSSTVCSAVSENIKGIFSSHSLRMFRVTSSEKNIFPTFPSL
jgi:hypothetical protein